MSAAKKILVVDDDKSIAEAINRVFTKKGFSVMVCTRAIEAMEKLKLDDYKAVFIDCMLPQMSGVDLATKISDENISSAPLYLMSGVYKDKRYIKEALARSHAVDFITKPFDVEDLLLLVSETNDKTELNRPPLIRLFSDPDASSRDIIKAIDSTDSIHSFDLPIVYGFLMNSGLSGNLNVIEAGGDVYGISLRPNKIVNVDSNHAGSFLGSLLVEKGFVTKDLLEKALAEDKSQKKLGQKLLEANYISPHAILEVMADQLVIRLSKTIFDTSVTINFNETRDIKDAPGVDKATFNSLLHDWLISKIPYPWLKAFYVTWMDQEICAGPNFSEITNVAKSPVFKRLPGLDKMVVSGRTIDRLLTDGNYNEADYFVAIHLLAILRVICFGSRDQIRDYDALRTRLKRVLQEMGGKNHFEILNLSRNARENEIKNAYHELAKIFHPDKLPKEAPKDIFDLNQKIFSTISAAFTVIKETQSRERYVKELEQGRADELLKAEAVYERAKGMLKAGQASAALQAFEDLMSYKLDRSDLNLYRAWAMLKMYETDPKSANIKQAEQLLEQIPPEDRHDAIYHFVRGLFNKVILRPDLARASFEKAIAVDPQFIDARREINLLRLKTENKKVDIWRGDLKDVVGMLFNKQKKK